MLWGAAWGQDRASEPPFRAAALPGTHGHQPEGHRALTLPGRPSDRVRHHRLWDQVRTRDMAGAGCVLGPAAARPRSELQRASHEAGAALGRAEHRQQPRQGDPISDTRSPPLQPPSPRGPPKPVAFPHSFAAGDVVLILPQNAASHVQQFCQALGLDPDQCFTLQPREPGKLRDPRLVAPSPLPWGPLAPWPSHVPHSLQTCPAPSGYPSPALCGTSCPSTWTSPACLDAPSSSSWPVCPLTSWSGTSCWS